MDPVRNPFAPGAGTPPPELAGRSAMLEDARIALQRIVRGRSTQHMILVGLRGVGKTVLLNRIKDIAREEGFETAFIEAHEGKQLAVMLVPHLRSLLFSLSVMADARDKARRALRVLRGFMGAIKVSLGDLELEVGLDPERGTADSGDLEIDLPNLMVAVGEAAAAGGRSVALFIDEVQYFSEREFSALIMAIHKVSQARLPVILLGAGLPQVLALAGESKSYAERLFRYPIIDALSDSDARAAIRTPIEDEESSISDAALDAILVTTRSYPYFLQQWGHDSWNAASNNRIEAADIVEATSTAIRTLDESFFKTRFERCTPSEKRYMRALAELGPGPQQSGEIATMLGVKTTTVGPTRGKLIRKGMIYSPSHGVTAFTVPLFDEYMRRVMPLTA